MLIPGISTLVPRVTPSKRSRNPMNTKEVDYPRSSSAPRRDLLCSLWLILLCIEPAVRGQVPPFGWDILSQSGPLHFDSVVKSARNRVSEARA
jgi:hypothetical protein